MKRYAIVFFSISIILILYCVKLTNKKYYTDSQLKEMSAMELYNVFVGQALGRSSGFGIAYEKNQLSGFQGIKFPWKPTLSGSIEYHGPPRSGRLSFP